MLAKIIIGVFIVLIVALIFIIFDISMGNLCTVPFIGQFFMLLVRSDYGKLGVLMVDSIIDDSKKIRAKFRRHHENKRNVQ